MEPQFDTLTTAIGHNLRQNVSDSLEITEMHSIGGGSINTALRIRTTSGEFFVKYNDARAHGGMFAAEARNLVLLSKARTLIVPKILAQFADEEREYLVLQFIEAGTPHYDFWTDFGSGLADLHKNTSASFGLDYDNYIGTLKQSNRNADNWVDFFINERIDPQLKMAVNSGKADASLVAKFESLYNKLPEIFPTEAPALLHGDLWNGNCMADENGDPVIYDPAVYYGHREMDLAMSKLFGGFESEFYEAYNAAYPLEKHWEQRVSICNLYPLLVHVNLFVGSYIQSIKNIVSRF